MFAAMLLRSVSIIKKWTTVKQSTRSKSKVQLAFIKLLHMESFNELGFCKTLPISTIYRLLNRASLHSKGDYDSKSQY